MSRIAVRGVIVGAAYDTPGMETYINSGLITPESRVRAALAALTGDADAELYINSQGGSVFAAQEMVNACEEFRQRTGRGVVVTVGALAASAGSMLMMLAGDVVRAHKNAKIMFHSAMSYTEGGPDAHGDTAELLAKVNGEVQAALVGRTSLDPDVIAGWFAEGRAGWLTAEEARAAGLIDEVIGEMAMPPEMGRTQMTALGERGVQVAAFAADGVETVQEQALAARLEAVEAERAAAVAQATAAESRVDELSGQVCDLTGQLAEAGGALSAETERADGLKTELEAASGELEKLRAESARLKASVTRYGAGLEIGDGTDGPATFAEAVAAIRQANPKMSGERAWMEAAERFPALHEAAKG